MTHTSRSLQRKPLTFFIQACLPSIFLLSAARADCLVNSNADDPAEASAKVSSTDYTQWPSGGGPDPHRVAPHGPLVGADPFDAPARGPTQPGHEISLG